MIFLIIVFSPFSCNWLFLMAWD